MQNPYAWRALACFEAIGGWEMLHADQAMFSFG
jgi:hypothetical protein